MTDLIGGQLQMMIGLMPNALPMVRSGRGLAVSKARWVGFAPKFPTIAEAGKLDRAAPPAPADV